MIGKILILATVAVANARYVIEEVEGASTTSDLCPAQGHHLLPHEWDCTKFYYCEYGQKWVTPRDCAPGTEFSYEIQTCVHPDNANCQLPRVPPSSEESEESAETEAPTEVPSTEAATVGPVITTEAATEPETEATTTEAATEPETEATTTEAATEPETEATTTEAPIQSTEAATVGPVITTEAATEPETEATTTEAPIQSTEAATVGPVITTEAATEPETEATTTEAPIQSTEAATVGPVITTEAATEATTEAATEAPELELLPNGCPVDFDVHQLLPHETRCDKFYYCVFGEKLVRDCPPNTAFNPAIQVCDDPANVDCVNASGSSETSDEASGSLETSDESSGDLEGSGEIDIEVEELLPNGCPADFDVHKLLPHESDCSKFYYCVFGETVERECGPETLFNAELEVCDWPENVVCANAGSNENESTGSAENGNSQETSEESGASNEETNNSSEEATTTAAPETDATTSAPLTLPTEAPEIELLPNGCPADFDVHQLLPHESDCAKFYYCVFGDKVERDCASGTHFNPTLQVCDWPQNAGCANAGSNENESTGSAENGNSQETTEEGGASNEETNNSSEEATTTAAPETDATTLAPITLPTEAPEIELLPNGCPADFDVHQLLPHESDCAKFYYCVFGDKVERDCASGTHFNPTLQVCDWPQNAGCANAGSNENESTGSAENGNSQETTEEGGASNEETNNSSEEATTTAAPETDATTLAPITLPTEAPEIELLPNGCPADFDVHQLLPHESDCAKFYYCVFGDKVERDCASGTHFNPTLQVCDWPQNAGCANAGSNENESTGSAENGNSQETTEEGGASNEETNNSSEEATTTAAPETDATTLAPITLPTEAPEIELLPNGCPADFDVHQLLPHESDCAKFYYCVFGDKVERDCASGTHFNPTLQVCDWPQNAGCANAGSNENESTGSAENGNSQETSEESGASNEETNNSSEEATTTAAPETDATTLAPITLPTEAPEIELLPNGCPADFDVHQLLPHESDCAKFYYCVFGDKVERDCASGTHFNPTLQVCDWPQNAGCANAGSNENESTGSAENGNSQETSEESGASNEETNNSSEEATTTAAPETDATTLAPITLPTEAPEIELLPNGCPADFDVHQLLPHESDCAKFYYCVFGDKVERDCASGTHFNPTLQVCDWPQNAGCANTGSNENESTGSAENGNSQETSEESGASNEETNNSSEEATTTAAPETDATTSAPITLPTDAPELEATTTAAPETDATTSAPITLPTDAPEIEATTTAAPETDATTSAPITLPTEAPEIELLPNGCPADFDVHQLLPHESDCAKFYYCVFGEKVERDCAPGTHFNPTLQVCDRPENAGCANADSGEGSGDSAENGSQESGEGSGDSNENNSEESGSGDSAENGSQESGASESAENGSQEESDKCKTSCNVAAWAHEHDCDKFWRCDGENAVLGTCSEGLHFNAQSQTCDFICNAGCVRDDVQSTGEKEGLKLFLPWDKVDNTIRKLYLGQN
ncbi:mucin-5AC-like [Cydia splendana]|uniref:mucin-5AC-like n=1 Tax=Cydia splendana TaxID=1100963 RepID=UPI00300C3060